MGRGPYRAQPSTLSTRSLRGERLLRSVGFARGDGVTPMHLVRTAFVAFAVAATACGKEEGDPKRPPDQPSIVDGDVGVYDGHAEGWDSNPESAFQDAATMSPCSNCVGLNCAADEAKYCVDTCGTILGCIDVCVDVCKDASPPTGCKTPMGSFDDLESCTTACYGSWPDSDSKSALLAGCLAPTGPCGPTCGRSP